MVADETVDWTVSGGVDAADFQIDADGRLAFRAAPDFEAPLDSDQDNVYQLVVRAEDEAGNASTQAVTVTVEDLDDTLPVITGPSGGPGAATSAVAVPEGERLAAVELHQQLGLHGAIRTAPSFDVGDDGLLKAASFKLAEADLPQSIYPYHNFLDVQGARKIQDA